VTQRRTYQPGAASSRCSGLLLAAALSLSACAWPAAAQTAASAAETPAAETPARPTLLAKLNAAAPPAASLDAKAAEPASAAAPAAQDAGAAPAVKKPIVPADIYDGGFFVSTEDKSYSLYVNGLFQIRYTGFVPHQSVAAFGEPTTGSSTFDVYLARVALSGSVFKPSLKYFLQVQGNTAGDSNGLSFIDWFAADSFSKAFTVQAGRSYTPYSFEYYCSPANYLFADLSTAEIAFTLPRAIGVEAYGQAGKLSYAGMVANSIRALDAGGQENFNSKLAYIGHAQLDILAPYGYVETDPSGAAKKPELTLWGSVAYNPIASASQYENVSAGDTTVNGNSTIAYRAGTFSFQGTGYWRKTTQASGAPTKNSWGYGEQAGIYLKPKRLELAERISGVNWGAADNLTVSPGVENTWFVGPGFPYHRVTEDSLGLNYYLFGHHAKIQGDYSYLYGNTFTDKSFGASRIRLQTQLQF